MRASIVKFYHFYAKPSMFGHGMRTRRRLASVPTCMLAPHATRLEKWLKCMYPAELSPPAGTHNVSANHDGIRQYYKSPGLLVLITLQIRDRQEILIDGDGAFRDHGGCNRYAILDCIQA